MPEVIMRGDRTRRRVTHSAASVEARCRQQRTFVGNAGWKKDVQIGDRQKRESIATDSEGKGVNARKNGRETFTVAG